jgi:serine/threonine-protein kinase
MTIGSRLAIAAIVLASSPAHAQSAEADVLFREGKKLLKAGKIAEACDKLDASERLETSVGTLLNLADCREKNHQLATAWAVFRKAAVAAKNARDGKREAEAHRREKLLVPKLSYLAVQVLEASRVDGLAISRNGADLDRNLWNQSVPIDAGTYDLEAKADGYTTWTEHVVISKPGQKVEVEVPALEALPKPKAKPPEPAPKPAVATHDAEEPERPQPAPPSRWTGTRKLATAVGVIGAAGIGAGIAFGLRGKHLEQQADALCPTDACADDTALAHNSDARKDARYANIGFAAGGSLVVGAIVLWLVGGPSEVAPVVAPDRVGIAFGGHF